MSSYACSRLQLALTDTPRRIGPKKRKRASEFETSLASVEQRRDRSREPPSL